MIEGRITKTWAKTVRKTELKRRSYEGNRFGKICRVPLRTVRVIWLTVRKAVETTKMTETLDRNLRSTDRRLRLVPARKM